MRRTKSGLKALGLTAAVVSIGTLVSGGIAAKRTAEIEATYPPIGNFVEVTGGRVHYVQKGEGPHVVLLHGAGGNLRDFTFDLMDRLTDDYTVTAFDRPGLGYTDRVPEVETGALATEGDSPQHQAVMLREAAEKIGIVDPIVVGHSFGAIVAMAWAIAGLDQDASVNAKGIVSFGGVLMPWPGELGRYYTVNGSIFGGAFLIPAIAALAPQSRVDQAANEVFRPQPAPDGYVDYVGGALAIRQETFRANVRQVNTLRPHVVLMRDRYPELTLPIEVIHGTADETVPIEVHPIELGKIVSTMNLTPLDGVGHMPHHIEPDAAVAAITRAATRAGLR